MRLAELLNEAKWYEDDDTVTLYHGTSSHLAPEIEAKGLVPPSMDLRRYVLDVLEDYIPRAAWTLSLIKEVFENAVHGRTGFRRGQSSRASRSEFTSKNGAVLYLMTAMDGPAGYARSYAQHGGEIAYGVWKAVGYTKFGVFSDVQLRTLLPPRWPDAKPIVVEVEVPKVWCHMGQYGQGGFAFYKDRLTKLWDEGVRRRESFDSFGAFADDALGTVEVRIGRAIGPERIINIHHV